MYPIKQSCSHFDISFLHMYKTSCMTQIYIHLPFLGLLTLLYTWKALSLCVPPSTLRFEIKVGLIHPNTSVLV